jgi:hypothetical protein
MTISDSDFSRLDYDITKDPPPDRRKTDVNMAIVREIFTEVKGMRAELHSHILDEKSIVTTAFPNSDPLTHRKGHEAEIAKLEAKTKFYDDLRSAVAKWGLIGILSFASIAIWKAFLVGPK